MLALASCKEIIDTEKSATTSTEDFVSSSYDLIIVCKEKWTKSLNPGNYFFLGTNVESSKLVKYKQKTGLEYCWGMNVKHSLARYVDFSSATIYNSWECSLVSSETVAYGNLNSIIWETKEYGTRCIYTSFSLENTNITYSPSFPIFISNIKEWSIDGYNKILL